MCNRVWNLSSGPAGGLADPGCHGQSVLCPVPLPTPVSMNLGLWALLMLRSPCENCILGLRRGNGGKNWGGRGGLRRPPPFVWGTPWVTFFWKVMRRVLGIPGTELLHAAQITFGAPVAPPGLDSRMFPKSHSLLLLAKLYLIQWVFPCTVDFPNVINFNIKWSRELCSFAPLCRLCGCDQPFSLNNHKQGTWLKVLCLYLPCGEEFWGQPPSPSLVFCFCSKTGGQESARPRLYKAWR